MSDNEHPPIHISLFKGGKLHKLRRARPHYYSDHGCFFCKGTKNRLNNQGIKSGKHCKKHLIKNDSK